MNELRFLATDSEDDYETRGKAVLVSIFFLYTLYVIALLCEAFQVSIKTNLSIKVVLKEKGSPSSGSSQPKQEVEKKDARDLEGIDIGIDKGKEATGDEKQDQSAENKPAPAFSPVNLGGNSTHKEKPFLKWVRTRFHRNVFFCVVTLGCALVTQVQVITVAFAFCIFAFQCFKVLGIFLNKPLISFICHIIIVCLNFANIIIAMGEL